MTVSDPHTGTRTSRGFFSLNFALLFVAHFIVVGVYFLFMTTMARHAMQEFACPDSTAGFVASVFLVGAAIARIAAGRYADALGLKRCSIVALVLMALAFTDQWYLWVLVNISSIVTFAAKLSAGGPESSYTVALLLKYIFYLLNSINAIRIWLKLSKDNSEAPAQEAGA